MKFVIALILFTAAVVVSATKDQDFEVTHAIVPPSLNVPSGRIIGGNIAAPKQFPYQAGIVVPVEGGAAWCGATVISDRWVLTVAHCTYKLTTGVDVYLGAWNLTDTNQWQHIIFVPKSSVIVHEDFDALLMFNDISLVKLPIAVQFNDYIQPAKLPKFSDADETYVGDNAFTSGWGLISDEDEYVTDVLRWIEVPIISNTECSTWFVFPVKSTNICINTTESLSTCKGDVGGPLVLADGSETLIGITSYRLYILGCEWGWPGVFTRITSFLDWIEENSGVANR